MALPFQHLIAASQITPEVAAEVFELTDYMDRIAQKKGRLDLLVDKVVALLFYEPSSRTMLSFQSAAQRLRAGLIFSQGKEMSSLKKRETIKDTVKVTSGYCDLLVMRHDDSGASVDASEVATVPFINAGDGGNEHPTQCLVDGYTIQRERGTLEGLHIVVGFDPLHSRAIRSFAKYMSQYRGTHLTFICPNELQPEERFVADLTSSGAVVEVTEKIEIVREADVLYVNRLQEERFGDPTEFERLRYIFRLTRAVLGTSAPLILDPLPRIDEVDVDVDPLPNAAYFRQAHYGVPIRMALMALLLDRA